MTTSAARAALTRSPFAVDVVLVAALVVLGVVSEIVIVAPAVGPAAPSAPVIVLWAIGFCLPLLARRRFPCTVLAVCAVHFWLFWATGQRNEIMILLVLGVAAFSVGAYAGTRRAVRCAVAALVLTTAMVTVGLVLGVSTLGVALVSIVLNMQPFLFGGSVGLMTRRLREYRSELERRNAELALQRRANEQRAVLEERVRIARELHDVVAHHVVLMSVQAGVAHRLFDGRPDEARAAVAEVQDGGRRAVAELQRTIGVLRENTPPDGPDDPSPGLDRLPALVEQVRRAGLPVELTVTDSDVDDGLGLSTYRIVQEALTNTLKHAGPAHATVDVRCGPDGVEVEIVDDGAGAGAEDGGGRGLVGIRERVAMHGGRLDAGPRDGGGFRVHAVLGRG
jgi:signal transduction histidine kinase